MGAACDQTAEWSMELRNRKGGITPAEGCMFTAVALFVILLVAMLVIVYVRFRDPPMPSVAPPPAARAVPSSPAPSALVAMRSEGFLPHDSPPAGRPLPPANG